MHCTVITFMSRKSECTIRMDHNLVECILNVTGSTKRLAHWRPRISGLGLTEFIEQVSSIKQQRNFYTSIIWERKAITWIRPVTACNRHDVQPRRQTDQCDRHNYVRRHTVVRRQRGSVTCTTTNRNRIHDKTSAMHILRNCTYCNYQ